MGRAHTTGVLRPAVAVQACRALGIELPSGKLRSAKDVAELQQAWQVADTGELVLVAAHRVRAAHDAAEFARAADGTAPLRPDLAERALRAWVQGAGVPLGLPHTPCPDCLTVLHEFNPPANGEDLAHGGERPRTRTPGPAPEPGGRGMPPMGTGSMPRASRTPRFRPPGKFQQGAGRDPPRHRPINFSFPVSFRRGGTWAWRTSGGTAVLTPLGGCSQRQS